MLITFWVAMVPLQKMNAFNVLPWLDIPFHIWGGYLLGVLAANLLFVYEQSSNIKKVKADNTFRHLKMIVIFVFVFGALWELWEYYMYITQQVPEWGGVGDTIKDMFDDLVGAVLAYISYNKIINRKSSKK